MLTLLNTFNLPFCTCVRACVYYFKDVDESTETQVKLIAWIYHKYTAKCICIYNCICVSVFITILRNVIFTSVDRISRQLGKRMLHDVKFCFLNAVLLHAFTLINWLFDWFVTGKHALKMQVAVLILFKAGGFIINTLNYYWRKERIQLHSSTPRLSKILWTRRVFSYSFGGWHS